MKLCRTTLFISAVCALGCGNKDKIGAQTDGSDSGIDSGDAPDAPSDPPGGETVEDSAEPSDSGAEPESASSDAVGHSIADAVSLRSIATWTLSAPLAEDAIDFGGDVDMYRLDPIVGVQAFIAVRAAPGLDVTLRILDSEEQVMGEVEVVPHRAWGSDPGIWFQARADEPAFIEVSANGGAGTTGAYELVGMYVDVEDAEPNDVDTDAVERVTDGSQTDWTSGLLPESNREFAGIMHAGGDVDLWVYDAPETKVVSWTTWQTASMVFDAKMTLYDSSMQAIAWSSDPGFGNQGNWYSDVGILYPVSAGQRYFLEITNERAISGAGTFYAGVYRDEQPASLESEPNDSTDAPAWLTLTESTEHPGYASSTMFGFLDGADEFDVYALATEDVGGQYVSIHLQTGLIGSGLSPRLSVTSDVAGTSILGGGVVGSTGELSLYDVLVPADAEGLYVTVEAFGRTDAERGNQYFLGLERYAIPLHD